MRVLLVSCVFPPEPVTSASTSHSLAQALFNRGNDVTVITPYPSRPAGRVFPGFRRKLFGRNRQDGIDVIRCFSTTSRTSSLVSRLLENLSFGLTGGLAMMMLRRPDVIYSNSWPIFASGLMVLLARLRHIPIVLSIQDVYPESLISLGRVSAASKFARLSKVFDAWIAKLAFGVIVISRRVQQIYVADRQIPAKRLHLIPNWRDSETSPDVESIQQLREAWGVGPSTFLFLFAGNLAASCGIEGVIEASSALPSELVAQFVIAGSGGNLEKCRVAASRCVRKRVIFSGCFAAQETLRILSTADVLILPTQSDQSLVSMPSKLISYMLAARPVLAIAKAASDLATVINDSGCGWVVEPGNSRQLVEQMNFVTALDQSALTRIGLLGRKYAQRHFSTEACQPKVIDLLGLAAELSHHPNR